MTPTKNAQKKAIWAWALYDFANSAFTTLVITFIYSTYFVSAIAPDKISGTGIWSRGITISAIVIAVLSPIMGAIADRGGYRKRMLVTWTVISIFGTAMLFTVQEGQVFLGMFWLVIANIAFEMGIVFNNAFLPEIAEKEKIGRISGFGWGLGYIGGLLALFIAFGFVFPADAPVFGVTTEGGANIRATNLLVAGWFLVFSIPVLFWLKEKKRPESITFSRLIKDSFSQLKSTFVEIRKYREIVRLLIARLFYNDGLLTIFAFGGIYAGGTFGFTTGQIIVFGIVLNAMAGLGSFIFGFIDDKFGAKKTIQISNFFLGIATIISVLAPNAAVFWVGGIMVGLFSGPNQSASRSLLARFVPMRKDNEFFGFFAFSGKATAFLGPLLFGMLTEIYNTQRAGVAAILGFFIVGGILLHFVNEKAGIKIAREQN